MPQLGKDPADIGGCVPPRPTENARPRAGFSCWTGAVPRSGETRRNPIDDALRDGSYPAVPCENDVLIPGLKGLTKWRNKPAAGKEGVDHGAPTQRHAVSLCGRFQRHVRGVKTPCHTPPTTSLIRSGGYRSREAGRARGCRRTPLRSCASCSAPGGKPEKQFRRTGPWRDWLTLTPDPDWSSELMSGAIVSHRPRNVDWRAAMDSCR